jgi:hypothetical protein
MKGPSSVHPAKPATRRSAASVCVAIISFRVPHPRGTAAAPGASADGRQPGGMAPQRSRGKDSRPPCSRAVHAKTPSSARSWDGRGHVQPPRTFPVGPMTREGQPGWSQAGLLASGSSFRCAFPPGLRARTVARAAVVAGYSGASAADSHGLPYSVRLVTGHLQRDESYGPSAGLSRVVWEIAPRHAGAAICPTGRRCEAGGTACQTPPARRSGRPG